MCAILEIMECEDEDVGLLPAFPEQDEWQASDIYALSAIAAEEMEAS